MVEPVYEVIQNDIYTLAEKFLADTSRCVFLTGKAGTGKTTFLQHIRKTTKKNTVVVAPTGVAAIHAGGVTIHSFFQLPFSPFVPVPPIGNEKLGDRYRLLKESNIDGEKKALLRSLELLIIDEVSMVRCDVMDAIDVVLRYYRGKEYLPFGGVQVLLIGDLFQLPPVMPDHDWRMLKSFYASPFFFESAVVRECQPVYLELKKIYRQQDPFFIEMLNGVRNNRLSHHHLDILNERYQPEFVPNSDEQYVTLTTHNHKADKINADALTSLPSDVRTFEGVVEGDFSERNFPTDRILKLKVGAQVMFIKNDMERIRRFYNGKIGRVTRLEDDKIVVQCNPHESEIEVTRDTWRNIRYTYNPFSRQVEEEELGTFTQYALRLAWAVTIHKSQGLTLEKVIIDAMQSFAPGQVYVALSRCTTLPGIILHSKIIPSAIRTDPRVLEFASREQEPTDLGNILQQSKRDQITYGLLSIFDFDIIQSEIRDFRKEVAKRKSIDKNEINDLLDSTLYRLSNHNDVAARFRQQLVDLMRQSKALMIAERVESAVAYFESALEKDILQPWDEYLETIPKRLHGYKKVVKNMITFIRNYKAVLAKGRALALQLRS